MRYQVTVIDKKGRITLNTAYHEQHKAYDQQIVDLLVRINVHGLVIAYNDGSHTQFGPMEYECELCEQYDHVTEKCPLIPEIEADMETWPSDDISWSPDDGSDALPPPRAADRRG